MVLFRSREEVINEQIRKKNKPVIIQNISKVNFRNKYLSEKFDGVQLAPQVNNYYEFKDITDGEKTD